MKLKEVLLGLICVFATPLVLALAAVSLVFLFLDFRERQEVKGMEKKKVKNLRKLFPSLIDRAYAQYKKRDKERRKG